MGYDGWMCAKCVDKKSYPTFVKVLAIEKLSDEIRMRIFWYVGASAMRQQCRKTWHWFLEGKAWSTNDIWKLTRAAEGQIKGGLVWRGKFYRTSTFFRHDQNLMDKIIDFLVGKQPVRGWTGGSSTVLGWDYAD